MTKLSHWHIDSEWVRTSCSNLIKKERSNNLGSFLEVALAKTGKTTFVNRKIRNEIDLMGGTKLMLYQ